jgi:hypothetical protein
LVKSDYVFRLKKAVPLLGEEDWAKVSMLLNGRMEWIKKHRQETGCSLEEAVRDEPRGQSALDLYESLTGWRLAHPHELYAVRRSDYGALCPECGKPFRTPRARICAECGYTLPGGEIAGSLEVGGEGGRLMHLRTLDRLNR